MDIKWLKTMFIMILSIGLCLLFTVTEAQPSITINGYSSGPITLRVNDTMIMKCTVPSNYTTVSGLKFQRPGKSYSTGNSYIETLTKTVTCDDNKWYRCYGRLNGSTLYSSVVYVTAKCTPTWAESVIQPVLFSSTLGVDKYFDSRIIGEPEPTYSAQKFTSTGLHDLSLEIDVLGYSDYVRLYFRTFTEDSFGVYQIVANNSLGTLTTNITIRGTTLPPKNLRAWSSTSRLIHLEWTAGEIFETAPNYYLFDKQEGRTWRGARGITDIGSTVSFTYNSLQPNTTYYFLVKTYHQTIGYSLYSDMAMATTLSPGDPPQTKPPIPPVETTSSAVTSTELTTLLPRLTTSKTESVKESRKHDDEKDGLKFEAGLGIGFGIGLVLVVLVIIGTVIYFKRSSGKRQELSNIPHNTVTKTDSEGLYDDLDYNHPRGNTEELYENVGNNRVQGRTGSRFENKAYNESL